MKLLFAAFRKHERLTNGPNNDLFCIDRLKQFTARHSESRSKHTWSYYLCLYIILQKDFNEIYQ